MTERKLSDLFTDGDLATDLASAWDQTEAAGEFTALPRGEYVARIIGGELGAAQTGTPRYVLTFEVVEGDQAGRRFWADIWLTPPAFPMAKRDLAKLGITRFDQLDQPLPAGIRCKVQLGLRTDDEGFQHNRVRSFEVLGVESDPFAPEATT